MMHFAEIKKKVRKEPGPRAVRAQAHWAANRYCRLRPAYRIKNEAVSVHRHGKAAESVLMRRGSRRAILPGRRGLTIGRGGLAIGPQKQAVKIGDGGEAAVQGDVQHGFVPFLL